MINGQHISDEDLALYAIDAFDNPRDAAQVDTLKSHLATCLPCRQSLAEVYGDLALVALGVDQLPLPAGASERFMERIAAEPRLSSSTAASASPLTASTLTNGAATSADISRGGAPLPFVVPAARRPLFTALPWMLAAAMLVATIYLGSEVSQLRSSRDQARAEAVKLAVDADRAKEVLEVLTAPAAQQVMLTEGKPTPAPTARTSYMPSKGALVLMATHMPALPSSKAYELWIIPANGHPPMAAGTFRPDEQGAASVVLPPLPMGVAAKAFGVTIERAEGSPVPTSPIIMSGS